MADATESASPLTQEQTTMEDTYRRPYRSSFWPSEMVWTAVHGLNDVPHAHDDAEDADDGEDGEDETGFVAYYVAQQIAELLSIQDNTALVQDLLPLAVWAVQNGAPAELVTFAEDAS